MKIHIILTLFLLSLFGSASESTQTAENLTEWMSSSEYQNWFDTDIRNGGAYYPIFVEGRLIAGQERYRAIAALRPSEGFLYWTHHSLSEDRFKSRADDLLKKGYVLISHQSYLDMKGNSRHQATWVEGSSQTENSSSSARLIPSRECLIDELKEEDFSEWTPVREMQIAFDTRPAGTYWVYQEGRIHEGIRQIRWIEKKLDRTKYSAFYARCLVPFADFHSLDLRKQKEGYQRISLQVFIDASERALYQGIWVKPIDQKEVERDLPPTDVPKSKLDGKILAE